MSDTKGLNNLRDNVTRDLAKCEQRAAQLLEERDRARRYAIDFEWENAEMARTIIRLQTRIAELEGRPLDVYTAATGGQL
jgi:hypothetical protein